MKVYEYMNMILDSTYTEQLASVVIKFTPYEAIQVFFVGKGDGHFATFGAKHNVV